MVIVDAHYLLLRAERMSKVNDRTYTITIRTADGFGNRTEQKFTVTVPDKDKKEEKAKKDR